MSDQTLAGPGDAYYLRKIVDSVSFNKLAAPPLSYLDKGIMYELNDGNLYYNGVQLNTGGASGDVVGPASSVNNNVVLFSGATGKLLKNAPVSLTSPLVFRDSLSNLLLSVKNNLSVSLGTGALPAETTGDNNTAIGDGALNRVTSGVYNVAVGSTTASNLTIGGGNTLLGTFAANDMTTGNDNVAVGQNSLSSNNGSNNVAVGNNCLDSVITGNDNTVIGYYAGTNYTGGESNNVLIANPGVLGESAVIRIGGGQTAAHMVGIYNNAAHTGDAQSVMIDSDNKLHVIGQGLSTAIGEAAFESNVLYSLPLVVSTATKIAPTTTLVSNTNFGSSNTGELIYAGSYARYVVATATVSLKMSAGVSQAMTFELRNNGVKIAGSGVRSILLDSSNYQTISFTKAFQINAGDNISCWVTNGSGNNGIDVYSFQLVILSSY